MSEAKRRLLDRLKRGTPATAGELAGTLELTDVAVRQHLLALEQRGLVRQRPTTPEGRGRPAMLWSLTENAQGLYPDRHADLAVGLVEALRKGFGEEGLKHVIEVRAKEQIESYRKLMPAASVSLKKRVEALSRQRSAEGYMAEVVGEGKDGYLLIEHHCPICEAARCCTGLCGAELDVFQQTLGPDTTVERVEHLLTGDQRCAYRIRKLSC